jgi:hypothetical protein
MAPGKLDSGVKNANRTPAKPLIQFCTLLRSQSMDL